MGATFVVSTSWSCSIQLRIPESWPAIVSRSASATSIRARVAMRRTVALSNDIRYISKGAEVPAAEWRNTRYGDLQARGTKGATGAKPDDSRARSRDQD